MYVVFWMVNRQLRATGLSTVILQTKIYCMQIQSPDDYNHSFAEAEGEAVIQLNVELNKTCTVQLLRCNNGGAQDANLQLRLR